MKAAALVSLALLCLSRAIELPPRLPIGPIVVLESAETAYIRALGRHALFVVRASEAILSPQGALVGTAVRPLANRLRDQYLFGGGSLIGQIGRVADEVDVSLDPQVNARQQGVLTVLTTAPEAQVQSSFFTGLLTDYDMIIADSDAVIANQAIDKTVRAFASWIRPRLAAYRSSVRMTQRFPNGFPGFDRPPIVGPIIDVGVGRGSG